MRWRRDTRLRAGWTLSTAMTAATVMTTTSSQTGGWASDVGADSGTTLCRRESPRAGMAMVIVTTLSHAKLPLSTSHDWVTMTTTAAQRATGCGAKSSTGTTSWAKWLARTSILCSAIGRWWKRQLSGPGSGWVSWW